MYVNQAYFHTQASHTHLPLQFTLHLKFEVLYRQLQVFLPPLPVLLYVGTLLLQEVHCTGKKEPVSKGTIREDIQSVRTYVRT